MPVTFMEFVYTKRKYEPKQEALKQFFSGEHVRKVLTKVTEVRTRSHNSVKNFSRQGFIFRCSNVNFQVLHSEKA